MSQDLKRPTREADMSVFCLRCERGNWLCFLNAFLPGFPTSPGHATWQRVSLIARIDTWEKSRGGDHGGASNDNGTYLDMVHVRGFTQRGVPNYEGGSAELFLYSFVRLQIDISLQLGL